MLVVQEQVKFFEIFLEKALDECLLDQILGARRTTKSEKDLKDKPCLHGRKEALPIFHNVYNKMVSTIFALLLKYFFLYYIFMKTPKSFVLEPPSLRDFKHKMFQASS